MRTGELSALWWGQEAASPVVAVAVHDGHALREEIAALTALDDAVRRREEDPGTGAWARLFPTHLVAGRSRFEVDLNRPRDGAVYHRPEDAWDLDLWRRPLDDEETERSLAGHDAFYSALTGILDRAETQFGCFVVYDLHTYNHRRGGPGAPPADQEGHPHVNLGTGSMDRRRWSDLIDRFLEDLGGSSLRGGPSRLDVRENVCFRGGYLSRWVHERYPETGCALAVEVKKFFMDEHTGEVDGPLHAAIGEALAGTAKGTIDELSRAGG